MEKDIIFDSSYIAGMQLEESFGKYGICCKMGYFCNFNLIQLSNQPHFHNCFELCVVTSGEGKFLYGNEIYNIQKGDIFIADPNIIHEIVVNKMQDLQLIYFFIEITEDKILSSKNFEDCTIYFFLRQHKVIAYSQKHILAYLSFIDEYITAKGRKGFGICQAVKNLILESLDVLSTKSGNLSKDQLYRSNTFELLLDYIDQNLNNKITISEIAKNLCVSTRNLQYLFKKHMNKTIIDYINEKKMTLASHHLMKQFSVSETANQLGLNSTSQFTRLFKKYIGITPKKYQQLYISKVKEFGRRQQNLED